MSGYEITLSITALCPCCGKELPSSHYLTQSKPHGHPLDRDNPYERKDRRVFITPCADCFVDKTTFDAEVTDAARWRRLVNASEMSFPIATLAYDPENDHTMLYGRERLEQCIDRMDEINDSYATGESAS